MRRSCVVALVMGAALYGCSKPKADAVAPAASEPAVVASVAPAAPAPPPAAPVATPSGKMAHCPSAVTGAKTEIQDTPGGITVVVTASNDSATQEIRVRSAFLGASAQNDTAPIGHNGTGEGGGVFGRCPVVMRNTKVEVSEVGGGARLVVTPRDVKEQDWLRRESRARLGEIGSPGSDGAGIGKMAHCPNAVKGATTAISDGSGAVAITVTAKDDGAVKEIRERARKIVLASQKTGTSEIKHDGSGNGGGGFGRCPIVLKDTSVVEKDAPGGTLITVKPKNAKDLPTLKQEVHERSLRFD